MRKAVASLLIAFAALAGPLPSSSAGDPGLVVADDSGLLLTAGADGMIRAAGATAYVGQGLRGSGQRIDQNISQFQTAVSYVRACNVGASGPLRFRGPGDTPNWVVGYRIGKTDITRAVVSDRGYRTGFLKKSACRRIQVRVRLAQFGDSHGHIVRVRTIPRSGESDLVVTRVHVVGVLVVP